MTSLFDAYLAGDARDFFPRSVRVARDRAHAVQLAEHRPIAPTVLRCLTAQQDQLGPSAARTQQLAALSAGASCVVTGQQVGLFLGPLFTLYKAATAIRLAAQLTAETGRHVVPVFWLQTEDHDLPEIAQCALPRRDEPPCVITPEIPRDNRCAIAHLTLPAAVSGGIEQLRLELGGLTHAREHMDRIARHYRPGQTWSGAFAGLIAELFEPEGLLVLDPRTAALAEHTASVHRRALQRSDELGDTLRSQCAALERAGFATTVHVRADSPLSFFHPDGPSGPRVRLHKRGEHFIEPDTGRKHTLDELVAALDRDPLSFSSSALLRPIIQDSLLPTAAYVGGPAEVAYFAQLPPLYAAFGMELSMVAPRVRVRLIEPAARRLLDRLQLRAADASRSERELLTQVGATAAESPPAAAFEAALQDNLHGALSRTLGTLPAALTARMTAQLEKTRDKLTLTATKLAAAYATQRLAYDTQRVDEVRRLRRLLFPLEAPQERVLGFPYFAARYGDRALIEQLLCALDPLTAEVLELRL